MKTILTTYSDSTMTRSKDLCCSSARIHGVDVCWPNNPDTASTEFKDFNADVFNQPRGAGYWIWKSYVVYKSLLAAKEGDILIYSDAGVEFVNSVHHIIDRMDEDIFFFTNGFAHVEWCKGDVIASILPSMCEWRTEETHCFTITSYGISHKDELKKIKQVQASVIFFKVNQKTRDFAKEWLLYSQMPGFIDDSPSKLPNYPTFAEHRHDQAICTSLQIKHGYKLHWWPTQYSAHLERAAEDSYPVMFNHTRKRNKGMGHGDAEWED